MGRALVKSGLCRLLTIPQSGYRLRFYPSNLSEQLWADPSWREPELMLMRTYLQPGDKIIDVGANVGDTALTASLKVGAEGHVWAIEAHPRTFGYLTGNIRLNGVTNVSALNVAASDTPGIVNFGDGRRDDMNRVGEQGVSVQALRLDDLIEFRGPVALLKVDVEGYELPVMRGAIELLKSTRCVYFEIAQNHFQTFGYDVRTLLSLFTGLGFVLLKSEPGARAQQITPEYIAKGVENLLAVRDTAEFAQRTGWHIV